MTQDIYKYDDEGRLHRDDGPAVIYITGDQIWYQNGLMHRDDGPAFIMSDGTQYWYQHGKLHRDDGPAVIYITGDQEWWFRNGKNITVAMKEWCSARGIDVINLSEHDRQEIKIFMASL